MIEVQLILQIAHFAISLFGGLIFLACAWLYFDSWSNNKSPKGLVPVIGFVALGFAFALSSAGVKNISTSISGYSNLLESVSSFVKTFGFLMLSLGLLLEPLGKKPTYPSSASSSNAADANAASAGYFSIQIKPLLFFFPPLLSFITGILYLRKGYLGLENHLKPVGFSFILIALSETLNFVSNTFTLKNIASYNLLSGFGPLWMIENIIFLLAIILLAKSVFGYLLKRVQTQLVIIISSVSLVIFLFTTVVFSLILLRNIQKDTYSQLKSDAGILSYSLKNKQQEALSDAKFIAGSQELKKAIMDNDRKKIKDQITSLILSKKASSLLVVSGDGVVLARGEEPDRTGDSLGSDAVFKRTLEKGEVASFKTGGSSLIPVVSVVGASVVSDNGKNLGVVMVSYDIDSAFADGVKESTNLDVSIYSGNIRSATTFVSPDGKSRWVGIKEDNQKITDAVLKEGQYFAGEVNILNSFYLSVFAPVKDMDNNPTGMIYVGRDYLDVLSVVSASIEITLLFIAISMLLWLIPSFVISRYIANQFK
nr:cache domain-containing protein [Candidatus Levybacteria bacterium]